jgi:ubiquinone/menaquinone biosynthesis C-methylase UbiE
MPWLMSAIYDRFMRGSEEACLVAWRRELLRDLAGEVLEIGAGTGASLAHYPAAVSRLVLTEPDRHMRARLHARVADGGRGGAEVVAAPADALPFPDASFDAVVSMLVLCSVPDVSKVLGEVVRVLRPGGAFVFLEHVAAAPGSARLAWQRRLEPVWRLAAGNCHLTRRTGEALVRAGFVVDHSRSESVRKALPIVRPSIRGLAHKPPTV